ncbi:uncharacterized protein E0L32_006670 [Thyridium curvatum]|uniref:Aminoglycoside phosphotransferase domain-containing protein n=1 Tax=Thyridium curvatum TaxID=1093900 RepID=A0A507B831_9PEZI|nr:uncharacterized protein E0L32_006670 [Thyridium curvatum]TPX12790.1 hypothetical protein E0L32_006670 [Thyridium curvatum]
MKLNTTPRLLELVLRSLEEIIKPELQTPAARETLSHIIITIIDLLKRVGPTKRLLYDCVRQGEELYKEILSELDEKNPAEVREVGAESFDALAAHHEELTERLTKACEKLCMVHPTSPESLALQEQAAHWELSYYRALPSELPNNLPSNSNSNAKSDVLSKEAFEHFMIAERGPIKVTRFEVLPGGFGKETYMATILHPGGRIEELVIRKDSRHPIQQHRTFQLELEFHLVSAVHKAGFPSQKPLELALNFPGVEQTFYTMPRSAGKAPGTWLDGHKEKISENILLEMAELLAKLHSIPLQHFTEFLEKYDTLDTMTETVEDRYRRNLQGWKEYVREVEHPPSPVLVWMFSWLDQNIPGDKRKPVLTHGDYAVHNMLATEDDKIVTVLDWDCADFGAPEQDIAYVRPHIEPHMNFDKFLTHYRACGGRELDEDHMAFYGVWSTLRLVMGGLRGALNLQEGLTHDLRYIQVEQGFHSGLMGLALAHASKMRTVDAVQR